MQFDDARRMLPRWHSAASAIANGEFGPLVSGVDVRDFGTTIDELRAAWRREPELGVAADFVSAASVAGLDELTDPDVASAVKFVLAGKGVSPVLRRIARELNTRGTISTTVDLIGARSISKAENADPLLQLRNDVRDNRHRIRVHMLDPLTWIDLARAHSCLGNAVGAERAMRTAIGLTPHSRFAIRAMTRLFVHLGKAEPRFMEEAWDYLRRTPVTRSDPWLAATEVALGMVLDRNPRSIKQVRRLLLDRNYSQFELGELAAALASLELDSGSTRAAKRLFRTALASPTENSIAQIAWSEQHRRLGVLDHDRQLQQSHEALTWNSFRTESWTEALSSAMAWQTTEPFSRRPVLLGTFLATVTLGEFSTGITIGERGLAANPADNAIRNNLAFAHASNGDPAAAARVLSPVQISTLDVSARIALVATWGLINFRQGNVADGRHLYQAALEAARIHGNLEIEALGAVYLAREEHFARQDSAPESLERASALVRRSPNPFLRAALRQVEGSIATGSRGIGYELGSGGPRVAVPSEHRRGSHLVEMRTPRV